MSYLETKRNALMNSVASSSGGGIEYIDTITIDTPIQNIDISVDTDTYKTFVLSIDLIHSSTNANWLYWGVNGTVSSNYWAFSNGICKIPGTTRNTTLICAKDLDGYLTYFLGYTSNVTFENVNSLTLRAYNGNWASGTVKVYGLKESIITME